MNDKIEILQSKVHDLEVELARQSGASGVSEQTLKNYTLEQAQKARNQAIGVLGFIALLGALGLFAAIGPLVENAIESTAVGQAEEDALAAADRASNSANEADRLLRRISASADEASEERSTEFSRFLVESIEERAEFLAEARMQIDAEIQRLSDARGQFRVGGSNAVAAFEESARQSLDLARAASGEELESLRSITSDAQQLLSRLEDSSIAALNERLLRLEIKLSAELGSPIDPVDVDANALIGKRVLLVSGETVGTVTRVFWRSVGNLRLRVDLEERFGSGNTTIGPNDYFLINSAIGSFDPNVVLHTVPSSLAEKLR